MSDVHPEIEKLVASGKLPAAVAPKVSQLTPGAFVSSKTWGPGKVVDWDLLGDKVIVDFEDRPGHGLKLEFAAKTLDVLPEAHFLARRFSDKPGLLTMAQTDPAAFLKLVLESHGGKMSIDAFEQAVKGKVIPEGKFKNWWDSTKKTLRTNPQFVIPSKRTVPLELRADGISPHEALLGDFSSARELKAKIKALEAILKEVGVFSAPEEQLGAVVKEAEEIASQNIRLRPGEALELLLGRDDLAGKVVPLQATISYPLTKAVSEAADKLHEFVGGMSVGKQQRVFDALPDALGDDWVERSLTMLNRLNQRSLSELGRVIVKKGAAEQLSGFLRVSIGQRNLSSDALAWVCRERKGVAAQVFSHELTPALMSAIERDHFDDDKKSNRVLDALMDDLELISDLLIGAEQAHVNNFARQVLMSPAFEELTKRSLMARIIKAFPHVQQLIDEHGGGGNQKAQENLIVSWKSLHERRAAHKHLVQVEIPKNTQDISTAREYGDLRENFEFKSAKEYQRVLMRRKLEMERDLSRARATDFSDATDAAVGIGTIVTFKDAVTGQEETYTILGAWDTDAANHIISYLSETAKALMGKVVGETAELPMEDGSSVRQVQVTAIKVWKAPSADYLAPRETEEREIAIAAGGEN